MSIVGQGNVEVSPVDAEVVAGTVEDGLLLCADGEHGFGCSLMASEGDWLSGIAGGYVGLGFEKDRDRVGAAVDGVCGPGEVGYGT